ncbi:R-phycoerythrin gamma chain, chloroplastic [Gracilariopsis chorda]|uniref:R-phycoerythrin gamma chain, chloroplastic n=1 Tax=Gracilariopsis chorda TaxID=448386 RepID=A0A2V3IHS8_9FLOR|nr:R-phycoerythrin gamma chain, chloroplastic [Gracilariopsis chorda]|eukprot:PXF41621.1 R-phycoerythrin gamma chain, chloroplastic [Gracilariopsis chorda]
MFAFAPSVSVTAARTTLPSTSFTTSLTPHRPNRNATTSMALRSPSSVRSVRSVAAARASDILAKAADYMANSVLYQYYNIANPTGEYGVQCTEGSVKGAAEAARVRALSTAFRARQVGPFKKYFDLYENRKNAIAADHICQYEETLFSRYPSVAATYNVARNEANGACSRYATPESVEEAAMLRYMDIQQNNAANPSGVYNSSCNEGAAKGQSEHLRIAALNVAYRNAQKPLAQILQEKYEQKKYGYVQCHGCNYEESLVSKFPAIGAAFRAKTYGY